MEPRKLSGGEKKNWKLMKFVMNAYNPFNSQSTTHFILGD